MGSDARLAVAICVSTAIVLCAPFLGQLRAAVRASFPNRFAIIVGGSVAVAVMAALVVALVSVRNHRPTRYGAIAAALAIAIVYILLMRTGIPEVDAVESVHFVEFGAIALLFYRAWRPLGDSATFLLPVLAGLLVGTLDEWLQWFIPNRVGEARDVFLNLVAISCGLMFGAALEPPAGFAFRLPPVSRRLVATTTALVFVVFAAFVNAVHLGYLVVVPEIGAFKSHYTLDGLRQLSNDRADRWRHDPPLVLRRLSREDQYLDEGLWHVRERNQRWSAGDYETAWRENQILETLFEPVLDTKTYAAAGLHRWPPEQKSDAQQRARAQHPSGFMSAAEPYPILTLGKRPFWAGVAVGVLVLLYVGRRSRASS